MRAELVPACEVEKGWKILHSGVIQRVTWITRYPDGAMAIATFPGRTALHCLPRALVAVVVDDAEIQSEDPVSRHGELVG